MRTNDIKVTGFKATVKRTHYDSLAELCKRVSETPRSMWKNGAFNGRSTAMALSKAATGATADEIKPIIDMLNKVDASFRDREAVTWQSSVAGAYPVVPEFLQGVPECMRQRVMVENDTAPVRLLIEVVVSAGVSESSLRRRAAALAALAMRLGEIRPVSLEVCWGTEVDRVTNVSTVSINTQPITPAEVAFAFADPLMLRNLVFVATRAEAGAGVGYIGWAFSHPNATREAQMREALGLAEGDIFIQGGFLTDSPEFNADPVGWVNRQLEKQREIL